MTRIISTTRERFLVAIAAQVPADRIAEVHFFHGIAHGGVESGVAVVAATLAAPPAAQSEHQADAPEPRFTVFTALYRLTLKGPDRGKWEASLVEEADAPLLTVETVVRGVQRRSGDLEDPERMDGAEVREILGAVAARSSGATV